MYYKCTEFLERPHILYHLLPVSRKSYRVLTFDKITYTALPPTQPAVDQGEDKTGSLLCIIFIAECYIPSHFLVYKSSITCLVGNLTLIMT